MQAREPLYSLRPPLCEFQGWNPSYQASAVNAFTHRTILPAKSGSPCLFTLDYRTHLPIHLFLGKNKVQDLVQSLGSSSGYSCTQKEVVLRVILVSSFLLILFVINLLPCTLDLHEIMCIVNFPSFAQCLKLFSFSCLVMLANS